ncbi:hypothetical protein HYDPIDRAFT_25697 [Hydnomerulius pinastri MD-312]|nr:hypothetical protein HYDPIDRAFT_25697 [Hydnomerulius pinastri MD-312]
MTAEVLEEAASSVGNVASVQVKENTESLQPLDLALRQAALTEEHRGLLLDAWVHNYVVCKLHESFFYSQVVTCGTDHEGPRLLETLFNAISDKEPWSSSQRWRAITASHFANHIPADLFDALVERDLDVITHTIAVSYRVHPTTFDKLHNLAGNHLYKIYCDAHTLSLTMKRDVLAVRLSASLAELTGYDDSLAEAIWSEMGVRQRDEIVGQYHFGLKRQTEAGQSSFLLQPKVSTQALLRHVGFTPRSPPGSQEQVV